MNQTEYIKGIKSEILKLDSLNTELENLTSMCAAFEAAFRNGFQKRRLFCRHLFKRLYTIL